MFWDVQLTSEVKKYSIDFGPFIPTGASVASGSTSYTQQYNGSASGTATTSITGGSIATFTAPALTTTGYYLFTTSVTLSDSQVRKALYGIRVDA